MKSPTSLGVGMVRTRRRPGPTSSRPSANGRTDSRNEPPSAPSGRLSSPAFHEPKFSVNIASIEDHAATLQRFGADCGLAEFLCADALALGPGTPGENARHHPVEL